MRHDSIDADRLVFRPIELLALGMATVTAIITLDGESHRFEGV